MAQTTLITAGIKMIKIAKIDGLGQDLSLQLREAKNLRLKFDDLGVQEFTVLSISEKPTFFLFFVEPKNFGYRTSTLNTPTDIQSGGSGFIDANGNINVLP